MIHLSLETVPELSFGSGPFLCGYRGAFGGLLPVFEKSGGPERGRRELTISRYLC